MSKSKPTPPSPTPGKKRVFDCAPSPKMFALCDLCSCWWNCMIFSESAIEPLPYMSNLPDLFQKSEKSEDITSQQPSSKSSPSSALVPVYDKTWQFHEEIIDSKLIFSPSVEMNLDENEKKRIMAMKEERHRMKLEILKMEKEAALMRLKNSRD